MVEDAGLTGRAVDTRREVSRAVVDPGTNRPGELGGVEGEVQGACGLGLVVFVLQAVVVAIANNSFYPLWWHYVVGAGLLVISLFTAASCLGGFSRRWWRMVAVAACAVACVLTAIATAESITSALSACTPLVSAYLCLLGLLDRPSIAFPAGGALVTSQAVSSGLLHPSHVAGLGVLAVVQLLLLAAASAARRRVRDAARVQEESHRLLTEALAADRAALESYSDRREQERELHDTVLNTLTALARASLGDSEKLRDRCAQDARYLRSLHSDATYDHCALGGGPTEPSFTEGLRALAESASSEGFEVSLHLGGAVRELPVLVELAFLRAVREGLTNAARHAGADSVQMRVNSDDVRVEVELIDHGVGLGSFVNLDRLGIRRSIVERLADVGGRASVGDHPRGGTRVVLTWPA